MTIIPSIKLSLQEELRNLIISLSLPAFCVMNVSVTLSLFCSILLSSIAFYSILFIPVFYHILFGILFNYVLFYFIPVYSNFYTVLYYCVILSSNSLILFYTIVLFFLQLCSVKFYSILKVLFYPY